MKVNIFTKSISVLAVFLVLSSCEKDFLDVNDNPNGTPDATPELILPAALGYASYNIGNQYQIAGGFFAQYWTQGPSASQYLDYEQYRVTVSEFNRPWSDMYRGPITDLKTIARKGMEISGDSADDETEKARGRNYAAISYIMQAYLFQVITDLYGDVPVIDAGKGSEGILSPRYDSQMIIYDTLIAYADRALGLMDIESDGHPGADDLFYAGDMDGWYRFANTLKLKIYLRQSGVRPDVSSAGIAAMYANPTISFLEDGYTAQVNFDAGTQFNRNPLFQTINFLGAGNIIASNTVITYFNSTNDPRLEKIFVPSSTGGQAGQISGLEQGIGIVDPRPSNPTTDFALPSPLVGGRPDPTELDGAKAPVIFMSDYESYFLQAEAVARGYATGDAAALYNSAIAASFAKYDITDTGFTQQANVVYPVGGSINDQVKAIITQKWAAMAGVQNAEAWTEYRRTNYPDFLIVSRGATSANGLKPNRLPYAADEQSRNGNFPGLKDIFERVWWDAN